jgi:hypothetical protein
MAYKYTRDNDRKIFTENGSKYADEFISLVREIDWGWRYEGENTFLRGTYNDDTEKVDFDFVKLECTATLPPVPCFVFGGYVYELLNKEFGGLKKFLDPTGDVDLRINTPIVKLSERHKHEEVYNFWYEQAACTKLNEIMDNYSSHLFSLVLSKVTQMNFENTVDFDIKDDPEGGGEDFVKVGNVYVSRICNPSNVKIQIVCKFSNMTSSDHLFEMVWVIKKEDIGEEMGPLSYYREKNPKIQGVFVQDLKSLILDNVGSANDRISLYGTVKQHKWFNHIQRLKYLNSIFKDIILIYTDKHEKFIIGTLLCYMFLFLLKTEGVHVFSLGDRVAKTDVIFNQLTSNFLEHVIKMKDIINSQYKLIYRGQRVTFSDEMLDKYFRNKKIDIIIEDIQAKYRDRSVPALLKPRITTTKHKTPYSMRRDSLKTQDNSKVGKKRFSKISRRFKSA